MQLTRLILNNVGQYRGETRFDLKPRHNEKNIQPIVLFGGKNGAGKTTLLQSILLCLYGHLSVGIRASRSEYESFLNSMIHDPKGRTEKAQKAEIKLAFEYTHTGEQALYEVQRSWTRNFHKVKESLHVSKNGNSLEDLTPEQWQDFINSIIPLSLSTLFFFDGEKIKNLAETSGREGLATAIHSLLGLDLISQLQTDLSYLKVEESKKAMSEGSLRDLHALEKEIQDLEEQIEIYRNEIANSRTRQDALVLKIQREEIELGNQGGSFAKMREENNVKNEVLKTEIRLKEEQLRELVEGSFPFCMVPELLEDIDKQVKHEHEIQEYQTLVHFFQKTLKPQLGKSLTPAWLEKQGISLSEKQIQHFTRKVYQELQGNLIQDLDKTGKQLHGLSASQEQRFREILREVKTKVPKKIKALCDDLNRAKKEALLTQQSILKAPAEEILRTIVAEIKILQHKYSECEQIVKTSNETRRSLEFQQKKQIREKDKLINSIKNHDAHQHKLQLMVKTQQILKRYQDQLKQKKITQLEEVFVGCWKQLTQKTGFVERVQIHPETYEVLLYNEEGHVISKEQLSSGEKQIYAIAILWALARISGRPLPIIADTPLGRLDSEHRTHLVERYFPFASHQVLILSTDTEFDREHYQNLQPSISHAFHLEFDNEAQATRVKQDYFWAV